MAGCAGTSDKAWLPWTLDPAGLITSPFCLLPSVWPPAHSSYQRKVWFLHFQRSPEWSLRVALALGKELVALPIWLASKLTHCCMEGCLSAVFGWTGFAGGSLQLSQSSKKLPWGRRTKSLILGPVKRDSNKHKPAVDSKGGVQACWERTAFYLHSQSTVELCTAPNEVFAASSFFYALPSILPPHLFLQYNHLDCRPSQVQVPPSWSAPRQTKQSCAGCTEQTTTGEFQSM